MRCRRSMAVLLGTSVAFGPVHGAAREMQPDAAVDTIRARAAQSAPPLWKYSVGVARVEEMLPITTDRLLVGLREETIGLPHAGYLILDTATGQLVSRFDAEPGEIVHFIGSAEGLLVFQADRATEATLFAIAPETGEQRWKRKLTGAVRAVAVAAGFAVEARSQKTLEVSWLDAGSGEARWRRATEDTEALGLAGVAAGLLWLALDALEQIDPATGAVLWSRPEITLRQGDAAQREGQDFFVSHRAQTISRLDGTSGATIWSIALSGGASTVDIDAYGGNVYAHRVRGDVATAASGGGLSWEVTALERDDGAVRWTTALAEPVVSALLERDGLVLAGTAASLIALDEATGRTVWSTLLTDTGANYPVKLRSLPDRIVYLSELVIAAVDPTSGAILYNHGTTPVSNEATLAGLDALIRRLDRERQQVAGEEISGDTHFSAQAAHYRTIATQQRVAYDRSLDRARSYARNGQYSNEGRERNNADYAARQEERAERMETLQLYAAVAVNVAAIVFSMRKAALEARIATDLERQQLLQRGILGTYPFLDGDRLAARPHLAYRDMGDSFVTLATVDLPTGRRRLTYLSPSYFSHGVVNVVDFERGVVYHHGVGLDPEAYRYGKPQKLNRWGKVRIAESYVIASPMVLPPTDALPRP